MMLCCAPEGSGAKWSIMEDIPDYSGEKPSIPADRAQKLTMLIVEMAKLETMKIKLAAQLDQIDKELANYKTNLVPTLMMEIGQSLARTLGGIEVELKDIVVATFPQNEEKRARAFKFLEENGDDGIVKREFRIKYGRNSVEFAEKLAKLLREHEVEKHATIDVDWTIHHQTLLAYLRRKIEEGANVPLDAFGAFTQTVARIKGI